MTRNLAAIACALAAMGRADAQVTFFGAQKTEFYTQSANDTAPTAPKSTGGYSEFGFVNTTSASDADSFTLSNNASGASLSLTGSSTSFSGDSFFDTKSALDADFPANSQYVFTANGGTLDGTDAFLPVDPDNYPAIVYLTGTDYTATMHASPNSNFTFHLGYSGDNSNATNLSFDLLDASGDEVATANLTAGDTSYTLSQSVIDTLTPGELYTANFSNFDVETGTDQEDDFSPAFFSYGFVSTSIFDFEVQDVPEPSQVALLVAGLLFLGVAMKFGAARLKA